MSASHRSPFSAVHIFFPDPLHFHTQSGRARKRPAVAAAAPRSDAEAQTDLPPTFTVVNGDSRKLDWAVVDAAMGALLSGENCDVGIVVAALQASPAPPATVPAAARACWAVVQKMLQISALVRERTARPLGDPVGHLTPGAWNSIANDGLDQDR